MTKATKANAPERPLTAREVANLCGVELKTIHNWADQQLLAHFRTPGKHLRFRVADVERFMAKGYHRAIPAVPELEASIVAAAVTYVKKPREAGFARLKKAVAALPEAS